MKTYGNIINRLLENQPIKTEIKEGDLLTEYHYSDRTPYEVTGIINQKHIIVRELSHRKKENSEPMDNDWELFSDKKNLPKHLVYRYNAWYWQYKVALNKEKYSKANIGFGVAEYYYDYSF